MNSLCGPGRRVARPGFTLLECVIALGVLAAVTVFVAQLATWSLTERQKADERLTALELAANVLEAARARPWADLTPAWADGQRLPDELAARLLDARLTVRVEPEPDRPHVKRVNVELKWKHHDRMQARTVALVGLFADRSAGGGS
jgi:prepilin-type N-terminal cleavage/methylation domain-containing protein